MGSFDSAALSEEGNKEESCAYTDGYVIRKASRYQRLAG
jgi:hypothetical protein